MLQAKPGAFARLGQGGAEGGCFLHNSTYDFNDAVIPLGAGYLAALAEAAMPLHAARVRNVMTAFDPIPPLRRDVRRGARQVLRAPRRRAASPSTRHVHPTARGAQGEELSIDVAVLGAAPTPARCCC